MTQPMSREQISEKVRIVANLDLSPSLERVHAAEDIIAAYAALQAQVEDYLQAFSHIHVRTGGLDNNDQHSDVCATCGLDLRDEIHKRVRL